MELQSIWFFLWGLLWALYFMTGGFDLGVGGLLPILGKTEADRRVMIHAIGPLWDGNEVWLITAGGVTFAAFPTVYAVMFTAFYTPLLLILFALIFRGVSIEFRSATRWTRLWDVGVVIGSVAPPILFGVAFANIFQGVPIDADGIMAGGLAALLNPYGLLGGVFFLLLFLQHGALWLSYRTTGDLQRRCANAVRYIWPATVVVAVLFLAATGFATDLYANYLTWPWLFFIPLAAVAGLLGTRYLLAGKMYFRAWVASAVTIVASTLFGVIGLYPNLFPSSLDPANHLTAFNSSASPLTLTIMLVVVAIFIPIVIAYQAWAYFIFRAPVSDDGSGQGAYSLNFFETGAYENTDTPAADRSDGRFNGIRPGTRERGSRNGRFRN